MSTSVQLSEELSGASSPMRLQAPRLSRRLVRDPIVIGCSLYLLVIIGIAIFAPIVLPGVSSQLSGDIFQSNQGPSWAHLLGTDGNGRDELQRLLVGTRPTMIGVAEAVIVMLVLSLPIGLIAGYVGGWFDRATAWWTDVMFSLPGLAIILVVLSIFPQSMLAAMVALGVLSAPGTARVIRSVTLPVREELYIAAARVSGLTRPYIIARHILPRIVGQVIVMTALFAAGALLAQAGLAYLGLIVPVPAPSWGGMVGEGISDIILNPWLIWPPGIAMTITVIAFGLLADAVRDLTADSWSATSSRKRKHKRAPEPEPDSEAAQESAPGLDGAQELAPVVGVDAALKPAPERSVVAAPPISPTALVSVERLHIAFPSPAGPVPVVADVSFDIQPGEVVGLMGESGCGKTVTSMSLLGLLPGNGFVTGGRIMFGGRDLTRLKQQELRKVRGKQIGLISQEPMASFTPVYRVGWQIALTLRIHHGISQRAANARVVELLRQVHLPDPKAVARRFPHELSGGMLQRVAIARALAGEPKLLIADEPTTALDVTIQAEILALLRELQQQRQMAILLVTHDWGVIADLCDRAIVMYAGQIVERALLAQMFHRPLHPYTAALLASNPHYATQGEALATIPGSVPSPGAWPSGCHFGPRCDFATATCAGQRIPLERPASDRETRCIHYEQLAG